jgi:hypothetical protein
MLPSLKIVIGAIVFAVLLFAVTGTGVVIPDTYTRIGEAPEIGRPMMQRMVTDEPGQAQFMALSLTRRAGELDRLRERTTFEIEAATLRAVEEVETVKAAVIVDPEPEIAPAAIPAIPALQPSGAMGTAISTDETDAPKPVAKPAEPPDAPPPAVEPTQPVAAPARIAALPAPTEVKPPAPETTPITQVKSSPLRRIAKASAPHRRTFHRARLARSTGVQAGGFGQSWYGQSGFGTR